MLWKSAGMHARKWLSNSLTVLREIPVEDRAKEVDLSNGYLPNVKTLGVLWESGHDSFSFVVSPPEENSSFTKRSFLKKLATVFDPIGLLSPFIVRAKILLQEIWISGVDWDENINDHIQLEITAWFKELNELNCIKIPRCLRYGTSEVEKEISLHVFADASQHAYGASAYLTITYVNRKTSSRLVMAKSKVSPLVSISIPRLELMAAVLAIRLAKSINEVLTIDNNKVFYWSDSQDVLYWIRGHSRNYKTFVANRIGEIHLSSDPQQWRYVPSKSNPADALTRGKSVEELKTCLLWWNGPEFIVKEEEEWPKTNIKIKVGKELKIYSHLHYNDTKDGIEITTESRLTPKRFSTWQRLIRISAWVYRFVINSRTANHERITGELLPEEIHDIETKLIIEDQKLQFEREYKALAQKKQIPSNSNLQTLSPMIDSDGLLRCNGRLKYAEFLPYDVRFPIILARRSWITKLIIRKEHSDGEHVCGINHTLSNLSSRYWIVGAREVIKEVERECTECRLKKAKIGAQIMAPLPLARLSLRPFHHTAVDYAGPFLTKQGRCRKRAKRYLCLFTCMSTRAVHLEIAYSLDTDSFLNAFFRMASRRGMPTEMHSDNGGNFIGANREMKELVQHLDSKLIVKRTTVQGVKWNFNPPLAPHFGGVHEIMIKAAKRATYAILQNADVNDEELHSAFVGAEALINSRPLTFQAASSSDVTPLTPNHFLHGQIGGKFAPDIIDKENQTNYNRRWRRVQELVKHFWHRWFKEWVPTLNKRSKWCKEKQNIKVDDVVLAVSENSPRGKWPLARVVEVFPGEDGLVRVVKVQLGKNQIIRSINKICPLEL